MRKGKKINLDKKDRLLLYLLDKDGRSPYSELARNTRLSKQVVQYRVNRLEEAGIIKGYFPMIDTSRLGFITFRTYLKFKNMTPEKIKTIITDLKHEEAIWAVICVAGKWDVALGISVRSIYEYYTVWEDILARHLDHINDYKTCVYSPIFHYAKAYLIDKNDDSPIRILGGKEKAAYDETDISLLSGLAKNARTPIVYLAKKAGISPELASFRLKSMKKRGIIQGYRAMIDVTRLGYQFYKAEIRLSTTAHIKNIHAYCHRHPNIYQVDKTIGGETLEIEFHVKNLIDMLAIIADIEKIFPGSIGTYDYLTVFSEEKTTYMPTKIP